MDTERLAQAVLDGRAAFERVCARARTCPHRPCRRRQVCLARDADGGGGWSDQPWFQPTGGCPVMSEREWRAVKRGIQCNSALFRPALEAWAARRDAEWAALPKAERKRLQQEGPAETRSPVHPLNYGQRLWLAHRPERGGFFFPVRFRP